ncbi:MAG: hypothetical protein AB8E82_13045 [Aureispira sp.]
MNLLQHTTHLIQQDFQLEKLPPALDEATLLEFLTQLVEELLEHNLERLFWMFYRLDVAEEKVHAALALNTQEPAAPALAALILAREQQKAQARLEDTEEDLEEGITPW